MKFTFKGSSGSRYKSVSFSVILHYFL